METGPKRRGTAIVLLLVGTRFLAGCTEENGGGEALPCVLPAEDPPDVDLPDGGDLVLFQTGHGEIVGSETDVFTVTIDCEAGEGFTTLVETFGGDMDVAYETDLFAQHFENDESGPGAGESGTLRLGSADLSYPFEILFGVYSANGLTGAYQIRVIPSPTPTE